ncbi:hypothetical protein AVEN_176675-1 [Araneus ventricosus]|uniref:Uncharacterized protein n=1 Tax=Araneus ventricosus TaxID=182803 RepID=A0A4Y2WDD4_ARAVE|nr:hypothetical protein AVEN_176675-1 [Araneus ventricosus]
MVTEKMNDQILFLPPQTAAKNKIKLRLPSDPYYSKWIFPSTTSCYSDRRKLDILAATTLLADRQYAGLISVKSLCTSHFLPPSGNLKSALLL